MDVLVSLGDGFDYRSKEAREQSNEIALKNCKKLGRIPIDAGSVKDLPAAGMLLIIVDA